MVPTTRKITAGISVRLGKLFGVSVKVFLNIQNNVELRDAEMKK